MTLFHIVGLVVGVVTIATAAFAAFMFIITMIGDTD